MNGDCILAGGVPCKVYRSSAPRSKGTVLYIHGGGLVYGSMDDYPWTSLNRFLCRGYDFVALGYPLAPETSLASIVDVTGSCIRELILSEIVGENGYIAFGRSAGVFLWSAVLSRFFEQGFLLPRAFLAFYGYANLSYFDLFHPDRDYRDDVAIDEHTAFKLIGSERIYNDPFLTRILLYIFGRQQGLLGMLLGVSPDDIRDYAYEDSLREMALPLFVAWSENDPEISSDASRALCSLGNNSRSFIVDVPVHDFDQNTDSLLTKKLLYEVLEWLDAH